MMLFIVVLLPLAAHTTDPTGTRLAYCSLSLPLPDEPLSKEGGGLLDAVTISCIFAIISALCISAGMSLSYERIAITRRVDKLWVD